MKVCAYCAGDAGIAGPAIVCLASAKRRRPDMDAVLYIEGGVPQKSETARLCAELGIVLASAPKVPDAFGAFGRWPKAVWLGSLVLDDLAARGYSHAVKLDYDAVCTGESLDLDAVLPGKGEAFSGVHKRRKLGGSISSDGLAAFRKKFGAGFEDLPSVNAGVMGFDLEACRSAGWSARLAEGAVLAAESGAEFLDETVEQWLIGFMPFFGMKCRPLSSAFNFRPVPSEIGMDRDGAPEPSIIHYTTVCKPWLPFDCASAAAMEARGDGNSKLRQLLFFNCWLKEAAAIPFKDFKFPSKEWTPARLARVFTEVRRRSREMSASGRKLERLAEKVRAAMPGLPAPVAGGDGRWVQFPMSKDGKLHFELLLKDGGIACALHFEGRWKKEASAARDIAKRLSFLKQDGWLPGAKIECLVPDAAGPDAAAVLMQSMIAAAWEPVAALAKRIEEDKQ